MTIKAACRLFSMPRATYYAWKNRLVNGALTQREKEDRALRELILKIVQSLTYIPGKRPMTDLLLKRFGFVVSRERVARVMKELGLEASSTRRKDAYKGQLMNLHFCCAVTNYVKQDFYVGCRSIVLTDITYIPYGLQKEYFAYLCTYIDAFTKEVLGWAVQSHMTEELAREAWNKMMNKHEQEFPKNAQVYFHSDQGCQYLSEGYKSLFSGNYIQSMSRRGNSWDNSPQESFFGRMKNRIGSHFQMFKTVEQVRKAIDAYIQEANTKVPQDVLGGLTPQLFYQYRMTGVYPKEQYFEIPAAELYSLEEVIEENRRRAQKAAAIRSAKRKDYSQSGNNEKRDALSVVRKDIIKLHRRIRQLKRQASDLKILIEKAEALMEQALQAEKYLLECGEKLLEGFNECIGWDHIPQLSYVARFHEVFR